MVLIICPLSEQYRNLTANIQHGPRVKYFHWVSGVWNTWWWRRRKDCGITSLVQERPTELRSFMRRSSWVKAEEKTTTKKIQSFSSLMKLSGPSSTHRKQNTWNTLQLYIHLLRKYVAKSSGFAPSKKKTSCQ